jgi:isopentenyl diphosphate isomerase/L-lactate dehydrogenase-like FMN-dependent dehydrogenase
MDAQVAQEAELASIVNLAEFEPRAAARLERSAYDYIAGGAGDEVTLAGNLRAWQRWQLRPRVLVDVSSVDTSARLLGSLLRLPVGIAPVAFQHFAHPDAELASARAAARAGVVFCLSTMSSRSIEEVAAAADEAGGGPRWFQLYVHRDRDRSAQLVRRAESAGYSAIVLTADFPLAGNRERDARNRLAYPTVYGNFVVEAAGPGGEAPLAPVIGAFNDATLSWADIGWLRGQTSLPIVVKGILTAEDAALAAEHGAAAVVVSNHGGRQLDRTPPSSDVLPEVVDALAGRAEVYVDGGIRRAVDILVALALGARGVFVGRPMGYALAVGGEAGVARAFEILAAELTTDMALLGVTRLDQLGRQHVRRAEPAG